MKQACSFVAQTHGIVLIPVVMRYYFKREKSKKKTGRSANVRKDTELPKSSLKKVFPSLKQQYSESIYFEDERRGNTRT